jgi:hypothetical protein
MSRPPPGYETPPEEADINDDLGQAAAQERTKHHGTTRPPGFYAPLKEAQAQAEADLEKNTTARTASQESPARPEGRTVGPPGWTDAADYVSQTNAARDWVKHNEAQRPHGRENQRPDEDLSNRFAQPGRDNDAQRSAQTSQPESQRDAPREDERVTKAREDMQRRRTDQTQTTDGDETERAAQSHNPDRTQQATHGRGGGRGGRTR